jgi:hypothetical protein
MLHFVPLQERSARPTIGSTSTGGVSAPTQSYRGRDARHRTPPAQIPVGTIRATGFHLGCLTAKRAVGQG